MSTNKRLGQMSILFISDNFPPETNAPAVRTYEHCKEWSCLGAEVTVLTCVPNFPRGKIYEGYKNRFYQREMVDGIKVLRVWSYVSANEGFLKRIVDYMSFAITSFFAGLFVSTDVIIATSPQFFTTFSAYLLSKIKKVPWVFELRDLWPESIKTVGAMENSFFLRVVEKIELFLYKDASLVIALTEAFRNNLILRGIFPNKIRVVTNGSNLEFFSPREKSTALLQKLGLEKKFIIGYMGTHGMAHGLEFIIRGLSKVYDEDIVFLFIGDGAKKKDVVKLAREKGLKNTLFLDPISKQEVPEYLSIMDAVLVPLLKSDTFKKVLPSKIFEAAAMKKPILLGVDGQARELVENYHAGVYFEPENELDFLEKLNFIKQDSSLYEKLQEGCVRLSSNFDRKKLARTMLTILEEFVSRKH